MPKKFGKVWEHELGTDCVPKTEANIKVHQERKIDSLVKDYEELEQEILTFA